MLVADKTDPEKPHLKLGERRRGGGRVEINRKKEWTDFESSSEIIELKLIFVKYKGMLSPLRMKIFLLLLLYHRNTRNYVLPTFQ